MVVEPAGSTIARGEPAQYMQPDDVTRIIDEVLSEADRGELLLGIVTKTGCNDYETLDYRNATVSRFRHKCDLPKPEIEGAATVRRKNPACGDGRK
jgi:hypothetical protein